MTENIDAITHAGEIPADLRPHIEAPEDTEALSHTIEHEGRLVGMTYDRKTRTGQITDGVVDLTPAVPQRVAGTHFGNYRAFDMLRQVFESQAYFQGLLGHSYNDMSTEELIEYLKGQIMALQAETIEALDEMSWKPWTHGEKHINKEAMAGELADILCFLVNLALGVGLTADDFYRYHQEKALRNIKRQEDKYDGVKGKCPTCRRDISDLTVKGISTGIFGGIEFCDRVECIETYRANSTEKGI